MIANGDSDTVIAEKAAKVLPRPNQTDWMRLERTFFVHFGVNTFNEVEWGTGCEEPASFNPTELDANQWLGAMENFGGKLIVLVCKHHDGFCLWPTGYTPHSVIASPWRGGKGDLVREVADAARARGIKLAVYLSPAGLYQLRTSPKNPAGYYGNGSSNMLSVIPTYPAGFKSNPAKGRAPAPGFTDYAYEVDDYNRYFPNQLYELLTQYGQISEVWFDGANPDPNLGHAGKVFEHRNQLQFHRPEHRNAAILPANSSLVSHRWSSLHSAIALVFWNNTCELGNFQLGLHLKPVGLLNTLGFYDLLLQFLAHLQDQQFLSANHYSMLTVGSEPEALLIRPMTTKHTLVTKPVNVARTVC